MVIRNMERLEYLNGLPVEREILDEGEEEEQEEIKEQADEEEEEEPKP